MALSTSDSDDYLTCGRCLTEFPLKNITKFIEHKKRDCDMPNETENEPGLICSSCPQGFMTAVGLLRHVQFTHNLQVFLENGPYQLGVQQTSIAPQCIAEECSVCQTDAYRTVNSQAQAEWEENPLNLAKSYQPTIDAEITCSQSDVFSNQLISNNIENTFSNIHGNSDISEVDTNTGTEMRDACLSAKEPLTVVAENVHYNNSLPDALTETEMKEVKQVESETAVELKKPQEDITESEQGEESKSKSCCTSQKCGVTVIPGSHESLQKCCYAVAPKKRKRHMETKHMPSYWSSRLSRRRSFTSSDVRGSGNRPVNKRGGTIYIDLEPETGKVTTSHSKDRFSPKTTRTTNIGASNNFDFQLSGIQRKNMLGSSSQQKSKSVILQPGAVFSIPIAYTVPTDTAESNLPVASSLASKPESSDKMSEQNVMSQNVPDASSHVISSSLPLVSTTSGQSDPHNLAVSNEGHTYGIDVQSLIALATSSMGITCPDDAGRLSNQDADTGLSGDIGYKQGRKRRYPTSKPFKCDQCEHAFNQRIHLKKHMSKHTGIKPFKCQQCNYSTVERSHLKVHIRIHTGEKPFKCTYCEYATAQNSTLKIHLKRHHGKQGTTCDFEGCKTCGKMFSKEDLEVHKTDHLEPHQKEHLEPHLKEGDSSRESSQQITQGGNVTEITENNDSNS